jgi:quinohemoprotein amine dehydrogenase
MIRLNGLAATPTEVRDIVRYLSNNNGLAPEEMKPGFWEVEHRTVGYQDDYVPNAALSRTCNYCHSVGRVLAQRRTRDDYDKLVAMHIGLFPGAANIFRPQKGKGVADVDAPAHINATAAGAAVIDLPRPVPPAAGKYPVDGALEYLASAQPLITPEWTSWKAAMKSPKLAGTWLLTGDQPGKGKIFGQVMIAPGGTEDSFTTSVQYTYAATGTPIKLTGKGIVYTGYNWRGRVTSATPAPVHTITATAVPTEWREAMMVSRDGNSMEGRWFWSGFGELGIDVHLTRMGIEPMITGTDISGLQSPSTRELKIYGANLPANPKPTDIDLGRGVTVTKIVNATAGMVTVEVAVAKGLPVGLRDLSIGRATAIKAFAVYDKISYIAVTPEANMARLGGLKYPKEYAQFEVTAYANGPDGKAHTADDIELGPVSAKWAIEEFYSTPEDDDTKFVGSIDDSGFFIPNVEGPNPARKKQANNIGTNNFGDVWVAASYTTPEGAQLKAKSYLVVTVPNYSLYDQPEVAQ